MGMQGEKIFQFDNLTTPFASILKNLDDEIFEGSDHIGFRPGSPLGEVEGMY